MHVLSRGVPHESFADFLEDAGFHHSGVEGVPEIMEAVVTNSRPANRRLPGRFDLADRLAFEGEDESFVFPFGPKELGEPRRERNLTGFALGRFRVRNGENVAVEVDVLPALGEDLSPPHARIERSNNDGAQMRRGRLEEEVLLGNGDHEAGLFALPHHAHAAQGIGRDEAFVDSPEEHAPEALKVAVHGRIGDLLLGMAMTAESDGKILRDTPDGRLAEIRQEHLQAVEMEGTNLGLGEKPGDKFAKGRVGRKLAQAFALQVEFILEALLDLFRLPPVIRAG